MRPQSLPTSVSRRAFGYAAALLLLNGFVAWPLFRVEITEHFGSIEPVFYAIAKGIKARWPDLGWWPFWNLGMPGEYTYQPLFHHLVAGASAVSGLSEARSYHVVLALLYALGPPGLFFLVLRLTGKAGIGLLVGLGYSLLSPSLVLIPEFGRDIGGAWLARRLHTAIAYGDGPYVASLTFLPIAIWLLDRAISSPSVRRWFLAALAIAAVPLTNIPGAVSLVMAIGAFALAQDWRWAWRRWAFIVGVCATAYILVAPWLPPSALSTMASNVQMMNPEGRFSTERIGLYLLFALSTLGLAAWLQFVRVTIFFRFAALFSLISMGVVLSDRWFNVTLIGQAHRFHLVMEMALLMLAGAVVDMAPATLLTRRIASAGLVAASLVQAIHLQQFAARTSAPAPDPMARSEYKVAKWMSVNAPKDRVLAPGSTAFWLNYWSDTPQMTGCCDQNALLPATVMAKYVIGTPDGAGDRAAEISIAWMKTLGVRYIDVSSEGSTEVYKDFHHPKMFDGILPLRWKENGEAIYEVPGVTTLAHVIRETEVIFRMPVNGLDIGPLESYVKAISDEGRPSATFEWTGSRTAAIRAFLEPGEYLSLQIPFHPGWVVSSDEGAATLSKDALGLLLVQPQCVGECQLTLEYTGGTEALVLRATAGIGWLTFFALGLGRRFRRRSGASKGDARR